AMLWTIIATAGFFVVVMMGLLLGMHHAGWFAGPGETLPEFSGFSLRQVSIFFTAYVFFQIWNEINCRSLVPEVSGFHGLLLNPVFLGIAATIVVGQVLIITFGGRVFRVELLELRDWLLTSICTASVLVFGEVVRRLRRASSRTR